MQVKEYTHTHARPHSVKRKENLHKIFSSFEYSYIFFVLLLYKVKNNMLILFFYSTVYLQCFFF